MIIELLEGKKRQGRNREGWKLRINMNLVVVDNTGTAGNTQACDVCRYVEDCRTQDPSLNIWLE